MFSLIVQIKGDKPLARFVTKKEKNTSPFSTSPTDKTRLNVVTV
jgi:hypothetical protein